MEFAVQRGFSSRCGLAPCSYYYNETTGESTCEFSSAASPAYVLGDSYMIFALSSATVGADDWPVAGGDEMEASGSGDGSGDSNEQAELVAAKDELAALRATAAARDQEIDALKRSREENHSSPQTIDDVAA